MTSLPTGRALGALVLGGLLAAPLTAQDNVLLIVADDMGVDRVAAYGQSPTAGPTPALDTLAQYGVLFESAYANPICSPTRATILTGRYGFRTGIGTNVSWEGTDAQTFELAAGEVSLADHLTTTHRTAVVGKWHLGSERGLGRLHPTSSGFDLFVGNNQNLGGIPSPPSVYFDWQKTVTASPSVSFQIQSHTYTTTDNVDDALDLIHAATDPWFLWLSFNAAHAPFHVPPPHLTTLNVDDDSSDQRKHRAAVEAMDTEIERLLLTMPKDVLERTWVVFVGDNGTQGQALTNQALANQAKGTLYEMGVHVPLIVAGPGVEAPGRRVSGLVNTTDLFSTILDMAGHTWVEHPMDSVSLMPYLEDPTQEPLRDWVYTEIFEPNGPGPYTEVQRAVRDERYKLVHIDRHGVELWGLFDLLRDPTESENLIGGHGLAPPYWEPFAELAGVMAQLGGTDGPRPPTPLGGSSRGASAAGSAPGAPSVAHVPD